MAEKDNEADHVQPPSFLPSIDPPIPPIGPSAPDHAIPDGGYGWIIVLSVFTINGFTWGVIASYGVYLAYYLSTSRFPAATPLDYAFIGGLNFGLAMLVSSPVTYLVRTLGTHPVMLIGVALQTGGFIAASFAQSIWHLYLSQGVCVGLGVGFIFIPSVPITSQWFDKKRSLANSLTSAGSGLGGVIVSFATQPMIDRLSLAWSLRIIGLLSGMYHVNHRNTNFSTKLTSPRYHEHNSHVPPTEQKPYNSASHAPLRRASPPPPPRRPPPRLGLLLHARLHGAALLSLRFRPRHQPQHRSSIFCNRTAESGHHVRAPLHRVVE